MEGAQRHLVEHVVVEGRELGVRQAKRLQALFLQLARRAFRFHRRRKPQRQHEGALRPQHVAGLGPQVRLTEPLAYLDLAALAQQARVILTDSGGLQKEAYWHGVPCVTLRPSTEWVDTVEVGANVLVLALLLHLLSVLFMGSYKRPRELTWLSGFILFNLALGFALTGYLLPWSQLSFWATTVATDSAGAVPLIGDHLVHLLRGGAMVGAATLGVVNKLLEPYAGAVVGKILVLIFIIFFMQKKPRGLFALKGLKQGFKVAFTEATRSLALNNLKENGGTVDNRPGEDL